MNVRPTPATPYELKLRLQEEQAFYDTYGAPGPLTLISLGGVATRVADGLDALSQSLRALGATGNHHHAA